MSARESIEDLWDRATPVGPLLDAYRAEVLAEAAAGRGRVTNADRLTVLRAFVRDYQGDITTRIVQQRYFSAFGPGDWRAKARQDLAQLTGEGLLVLDETDPGRRCYRFNYAHGGQL